MGTKTKLIQYENDIVILNTNIAQLTRKNDAINNDNVALNNELDTMKDTMYELNSKNNELDYRTYTSFFNPSI